MLSALLSTAPLDQKRRRFATLTSLNVTVIGLGLNRLGEDSNVGDTALFYRVHERGECAEGNVLVTTQINRMMLRILYFVVENRGQLSQFDRIASQKDILIA